jgi:hypothetical protein
MKLLMQPLVTTSQEEPTPRDHVTRDREALAGSNPHENGDFNDLPNSGTAPET